jgi:protein TonB
MFDELLESSVKRKKTNQGWTVILSAVIQVFILVILILIPLIYTEALPKAAFATLLVAPPPPPPPPPPAATPVVRVQPVKRLMNAGVLRAPTAIPKQVTMIKEEALPPEVSSVGVTGGVPGGVPGGQAGGVLGGILGGVVGGAPPPPKEAPKRIVVGGNVQQARLIAKPTPVYPPLARQARIQGTVRLQAIIAKDGTIQSLEVVSGHPLLVQSALDAVRQWRYQPTLLNGEPVEVSTTIDVVFTLSS